MYVLTEIPCPQPPEHGIKVGHIRSLRFVGGCINVVGTRGEGILEEVIILGLAGTGVSCSRVWILDLS